MGLLNVYTGCWSTEECSAATTTPMFKMVCLRNHMLHNKTVVLCHTKQYMGTSSFGTYTHLIQSQKVYDGSTTSSIVDNNLHF